MSRFTKYGVRLLAVVGIAATAVLVSGWGSAVASSISDVFITNDAAHAVPVKARRLSSHSRLAPAETQASNEQTI